MSHHDSNEVNFKQELKSLGGMLATRDSSDSNHRRRSDEDSFPIAANDRNYANAIQQSHKKQDNATWIEKHGTSNCDVNVDYPFNKKALELAIIDEQSKIIREALYALQGMNGEFLTFVNDRHNHDSLGQTRINQSAAVLNVSLPAEYLSFSKLGGSGIAAKYALAFCFEVGCMYNRIQSYIDYGRYGCKSYGSVARAFATVLSEHMQSYRNFLIDLEQRLINSATYLLNHEYPIHHLRDILIALQVPFQRLRTLAMLTDSMLNHTSESVASARQYQFDAKSILTALYRHGRCHGDSRHAAILESLLKSSSRPWFDMLYDWCMEGRLSDPKKEFFISASSRNLSGSIQVQHLWQNGYFLDYDKIPQGILETDLVALVFVVGKGINYIRQCLHNDEWSIDDEHLLEQLLDEQNSGSSSSLNEQSNLKLKLGFCYSVPSLATSQEACNSQLRKTLELSARIVHAHILDALHDEHNIMHHLYALKQFLLLGQGDFFSALMDSLHAENERTTDAFTNGKGGFGIYSHTLSALVESSIRSTNAASFSPDILGRVQVDLLLHEGQDSCFVFGTNDSPCRQNLWNFLSFDYIIPDPLVAIVHNAAMNNYKRLFRLLFGLKRVEFLLNLTWRQSAVLQHALHLQAQYMGLTVDTSRPYAMANSLLRQVSMTRQAMMHFVGNLKSYLMFEVLEGEWKALVLAISDARTLDEVINAHDNYLSGIMRKSLLGEDNKHSTTNGLAEQMEKPLQLAHMFCTYQEQLFGLAQEEADTAAEKRREAEKRSSQGNWGFDDVNLEEENFFGLSDGTKLKDLNQLSKEFNSQVYGLLKALENRLNGGPAWSVSDIASPSSPSQLDIRQQLLDLSLSDRDDLDCLRFLIFQLDNNNYYGVT